MSAKYRSKRFCSDKCRVYFGREKELKQILKTGFDENMEEFKKIEESIINKEVASSKVVVRNGKIEIDKVDVLQEPMSEWEAKMAIERIEVLKKEIKNPPPNLKIPKKMYLSVREKELAELENKIK